MRLKIERDDVCILHTNIHHMHLNAHSYLKVIYGSLNGSIYVGDIIMVPYEDQLFDEILWYVEWTGYVIGCECAFYTKCEYKACYGLCINLILLCIQLDCDVYNSTLSWKLVDVMIIVVFLVPMVNGSIIGNVSCH